ncbi:MAG: TOBE domain-containing protein, partial [Reyranella sp.]|nr:TOBE domain-containing protein [Reyranella sp.]
MTPEEWTAARLSLLVATTATLASLPLGVAIAWLLARRERAEHPVRQGRGDHAGRDRAGRRAAGLQRARVTAKSVDRLALAPGRPVYAVVK